jgi:diketogulonate reductase-like aldo/keto reductase
MWRAFEDLVAEGKVKSIGLSHIHDPASLHRLLGAAKIKPSFIQHPIFASNGWDREIRQICRQHGILFQAYYINHPENDLVYQTETVT